VDTARWYFYTVNNPGDSKQFSMKEVRERFTGFMGTLQNCVKFWELYADHSEARNFSHGDTPTHLLDCWIMSRLHRLIGDVTSRLDVFDLTASSRAIEQFVIDDLSQWWLRRSRKRTQSLGLLRHVLLELDKLIAPFIPFTAEDMHLRLHAGSAPSTASVHLHDWPTANEHMIDPHLEEEMVRVREFISAGLAIRKDQAIKVRQPLAAVTVPGKALPADLEALIMEELNVKKVITDGTDVTLDLNVSPELRAEGYARETMRLIQDMRKDAGLSVGDRVLCHWSTEDAEIGAALELHAQMIARETGLSSFLRHADLSSMMTVKELDLAPGKRLNIGIQK
jgi:isoleucyl-tRNA synthetase